jgi:hypothetical protein
MQEVRAHNGWDIVAMLEAHEEAARAARRAERRR